MYGLGRVLVVEDDETVASTLANILRDEGYSAAVVTDGREAMDWLRSSSPPPHLILLDLWMPGMDGESFRRQQLHDPRLASIPLVVISAARDARERAQAMGAAGLLPKPINLDALLNYVERHTGQ
jgi:CheY-like chemotaxis protein